MVDSTTVNFVESVALVSSLCEPFDRLLDSLGIPVWFAFEQTGSSDAMIAYAYFDDPISAHAMRLVRGQSCIGFRQAGGRHEALSGLVVNRAGADVRSALFDSWWPCDGCRIVERSVRDHLREVYVTTDGEVLNQTAFGGTYFSPNGQPYFVRSLTSCDANLDECLGSSFPVSEVEAFIPEDLHDTAVPALLEQLCAERIAMGCDALAHIAANADYSAPWREENAEDSLTWLCWLANENVSEPSCQFMQVVADRRMAVQQYLESPFAQCSAHCIGPVREGFLSLVERFEEQAEACKEGVPGDDFPDRGTREWTLRRRCDDAFLEFVDHQSVLPFRYCLSACEDGEFDVAFETDWVAIASDIQLELERKWSSRPLSERYEPVGNGEVSVDDRLTQIIDRSVYRSPVASPVISGSENAGIDIEGLPPTASPVFEAIRAAGRVDATGAEVSADFDLAQQITDQCELEFCGELFSAAEQTTGQRAIHEANACLNACVYMTVPLDTPGIEQFRELAIQSADLALSFGSVDSTVVVISGEFRSPTGTDSLAPAADSAGPTGQGNRGAAVRAE